MSSKHSGPTHQPLALFAVEEKANAYVVYDGTKNTSFVIPKVRRRYVGACPCGEAEDIRTQCSHQMAVREFLMERWSHGKK